MATTKKQFVLNSIDDIVEMVKYKTQMANRPRNGFIYLIESRCKNLLKIGRSVRPEHRIAEISSISGGVGRIYTSQFVLDATAIESALHKAYSGLRIKGEWFAMDFDEAKNVVSDLCGKFETTKGSEDDRIKFGYEEGDRIFKGLMAHFNKPQ